jgi:6-phosphogluconolactonase
MSEASAVYYAGVGPELIQYDIDVAAATLTRRSSVRVPANVQYLWQHGSRDYVYVTSSDRGPGASAAPAANTHHVTAFRVDRASGALKPHGSPVALRQRPIHMTLDNRSEHVLIAYSEPSGLSVHKINRDGSIGDEVKQPGLTDVGIYAHQVRVAPSNTMVILVTRGHDPKEGKPEDPGAFKVYKYKDGLLSNCVSIAPGGGYGFGPRHLDFHPTRPWVYVSLERQNKLQLFTLDGDTLSREALFSVDTLAEPGNRRPRQLAGTTHVHPNGKYVYGCERATTDVAGQAEGIYTGGENTVVAYAIDQQTGKPSFIQRVDTHGMHPRTFAIEPSGRLMVVGNKSPVAVKEGGNTRTVPASLDLFRVGADGKLEFARKYDIDVGSASMFWSGLVLV